MKILLADDRDAEYLDLFTVNLGRPGRFVCEVFLEHDDVEAELIPGRYALVFLGAEEETE